MFLGIYFFWVLNEASGGDSTVHCSVTFSGLSTGVHWATSSQSSDTPSPQRYRQKSTTHLSPSESAARASRLWSPWWWPLNSQTVPNSLIRSEFWVYGTVFPRWVPGSWCRLTSGGTTAWFSLGCTWRWFPVARPLYPPWIAVLGVALGLPLRSVTGLVLMPLLVFL